MKYPPILPETAQDWVFFASLGPFCQILSHKYGIQITFQGNKAHTDWETNINLPEYALHLRGSEARKLVVGYVYHELSHVICGSAKSAAGLNDFQFVINNILSDARDEVHMSSRYLGARQPLFYMIDALFSKNATVLTEQSKVALGFMLIYVRHYVYRLFSERLNGLAEQFDAMFGAELRCKIEEVSGKAVIAATSEEVAQTAVLIASWFADLAKQYKKEKPQYSHMSDGAGDPSSDGPPQNHDQGDNNDKKDSDYGANADAFVNDSGLKEMTGAQDFITKVIARDKAEAGSGGSNEIQADSLAAKSGTSRKPLTMAKPSGFTGYTGVLDDRLVLDSTVVLRTKLHAMFKNAERVVSRPATSGRLDTRRMIRAAMGYPDVFRRVTEVVKLNIGVHLLIDCSSSMRLVQSGQSYPNIEMACAAAQCMATVCRSVSNSVNLAATAFPSIKSNDYVDELLRHGSRLPNGAMWKRPATGNTPLAGALLFAMSRLQALRNDRKVVIILSDGKADYPQDVARIVKGGQRQGIECLGLSLFKDHMADFLPKHAYSVIASPADIAQGYFDIFKGFISPS